MRLNPHYPPMYSVELGRAYCYIGRYAEAIATLKEANIRIPSFGEVHILLALSYLGQWLSQEELAKQTLDKASTAARRALTLLNDSYISHVVLGEVYLYQQQYDEALAEIERAVAAAPTETRAYAALAMVLSCMGRLEDALEAAAQARRLLAGDRELAVRFHSSGLIPSRHRRCCGRALQGGAGPFGAAYQPLPKQAGYPSHAGSGLQRVRPSRRGGDGGSRSAPA
jgi:tetratricopeptide (TPR) repeat protein